jgi:hypothetical protein
MSVALWTGLRGRGETREQAKSSAISIPTMTPNEPTASYGSSPNGMTLRKAGSCFANMNDQ